MMSEYLGKDPRRDAPAAEKEGRVTSAKSGPVRQVSRYVSEPQEHRLSPPPALSAVSAVQRTRRCHPPRPTPSP